MTLLCWYSPHVLISSLIFGVMWMDMLAEHKEYSPSVNQGNWSHMHWNTMKANSDDKDMSPLLEFPFLVPPSLFLFFSSLCLSRCFCYSVPCAPVLVPLLSLAPHTLFLFFSPWHSTAHSSGLSTVWNKQYYWRTNQLLPLAVNFTKQVTYENVPQ